MTSVLTIAGSDSSGGAGIQADLRTFAAFGVRGLTAVTALTVQDSGGVQAVFEVPADFVTRQVVSAINEGVAAAKTGMLANAEVVEAVAQVLDDARGLKLVIDPVITSTLGPASGRFFGHRTDLRSVRERGLFIKIKPLKTAEEGPEASQSGPGYRLLDEEGVAALLHRLLPLCLVITPNLDEAEALSGLTVRTTGQMREAARAIHDKGAPNVLVKGGHLEGDSTDIFFDGSSFEELNAKRIEGADTHGTGCVLSAAITARLALGDSTLDAIATAKQFVTETLLEAV